MKTTIPTSIIILGGGGDLAQRKLLPSLCTLFIQGHLPQAFRITGLARTERSNQEYRALVEEALKKSDGNFRQEDIDSFCMHVTYVSGSLEESQSYKTLKATIEDFEAEADTKVNVLFYLAVPPTQYETTFINLHESKLAVLEEGSTHWARILVEKPFGNDFASAQKLDATLSSLFPEEQIFRIDHYLAKEAVQNILSFRFANRLLLPSWNNKAIKSVTIDTTQLGHCAMLDKTICYKSLPSLQWMNQSNLMQHIFGETEQKHF
jgi:glucose-6-phosphate 1-dehydrogenase